MYAVVVELLQSVVLLVRGIKSLLGHTINYISLPRVFKSSSGKPIRTISMRIYMLYQYWIITLQKQAYVTVFSQSKSSNA